MIVGGRSFTTSIQTSTSFPPFVMETFKKLILRSAPFLFVGVVLMFFAFGVFTGVKEEQRSIEIEQKIVTLQEDYRELAAQAEEQRVHCVRVSQMEEQLGAMNRLANGLRSELATYGKKG